MNRQIGVRKFKYGVIDHHLLTGGERVTRPTFRILGTVGARNFKFGTHTDHHGYKRKKCKIRSNGVGEKSGDLLLKFWDPLYISGTVELETSNLARRLTTGLLTKKNAKLGQRGSGGDHVTYFPNFWTPFISRKRLILETSNLACRLITRGINERNAKLGQRGSGKGYVTYF